MQTMVTILQLPDALIYQCNAMQAHIHTSYTLHRCSDAECENCKNVQFLNFLQSTAACILNERNGPFFNAIILCCAAVYIYDVASRDLPSLKVTE